MGTTEPRGDNISLSLEKGARPHSNYRRCVKDKLHLLSRSRFVVVANSRQANRIRRAELIKREL